MKFAIRNTISVALSMLIIFLSIGFNVLCHGCSIHNCCESHHCHDHNHVELVKCNHEAHQSQINDCDGKFLKLDFQSIETNDSNIRIFHVECFETAPIFVLTLQTTLQEFVLKKIQVHRTGQSILKNICKMTC